MSKKPLFIGAIASIIAINQVVADTTVTSKQYVDTTRQATIPAAGTNANTPGSTVVTYTGTAGQIGERGIFNPETNFDYENNEVASGHEDDLVTAGSIFPAVGDLYQQIEQATNLPTITTSKMTCVDSPDCTLWAVADQTVYGQCLGHGQSCGTTTAECAARCCDGASISCSGNNCRCYSSNVQQ